MAIKRTKLDSAQEKIYAALLPLSADERRRVLTATCILHGITLNVAGSPVEPRKPRDMPPAKHVVDGVREKDGGAHIRSPIGPSIKTPTAPQVSAPSFGYRAAPKMT